MKLSGKFTITVIIVTVLVLGCGVYGFNRFMDHEKRQSQGIFELTEKIKWIEENEKSKDESAGFAIECAENKARGGITILL